MTTPATQTTPYGCVEAAIEALTAARTATLDRPDAVPGLLGVAKEYRELADVMIARMICAPRPPASTGGR